MILADCLAAAIEKLRQAGVDNPGLDTRLLACHALGMDRAQLLSRSQRALNAGEARAIESLIERRAKRESVARIIGSREFWGLNFGLNEATLEPRPDSECLVEAIMKLSGRQQPRILDLGTGTGCLLLALLHEMPGSTGIGVDIDPRAVEQAAKNAATLGLGARAVFQIGDWLNGIAERFDIIVSNPPYIPAFYISALMPEVRSYDPLPALDGGADGLAPYRLLIPQLKNVLKPGGMAVFEAGVTQAPQIVDLFRKAGFADIAAHRDLGGIDRCVTAFYGAPENGHIS